MTTSIVCIEGDGIGPEITRAMKRVVALTVTDIAWIDMPAGLSALRAHGSALPSGTVDAIRTHRLAIKGPTGTPKGEGHSSINVELRKIFDLYVGFRPYRSLPLPGQRPVDITLFRQNTEGLYAVSERVTGTPGARTVELTATFTEFAMTRLAARAFSHAQMDGFNRVTLVTKSNIHKAWGKLYRDAFMAVAGEVNAFGNEAIVAEELLVDATAMMLERTPERFEVIVTENMFGDILSDLCAGLIGGLGVAPGANLGDDCAIFEAVHGTADDIAGRDLANPTALILSAALMLDRIGKYAAAGSIRKAVDAVVADGKHVTGDLLTYYPKGTLPCTTSAFTDAVIDRIRAI